MTAVRGDGRSSYITRSSVHNSRIERLWRDVYASVTSTFSAIFYALEANEVLDPLNEVDLFCLHHVNAWNNHPLSTESNYSPLQLFLRYSIGNPLFIDTDDNVFPSITANVVRDDIPSISVPEINLPLSDRALHFR